MENEKILSYNDVVLRRPDLHILSGPYFLNDRIIEFYFSYLSSSFLSEDILLVPPSIAFWIKESPDIPGLKDFIDPLHLSQRKIILFPINNNTDVSRAEGGSHWSLLAYVKDANVFIHHDSNRGNRPDAERVYRAVNYFTKPGATFVECSSTPKQENWYDCGVYVTAIAKAICDWYGNDEEIKDMKDLWFSAFKEKITPSIVSKMRGEIRQLVLDLMIKQ